MHPLTFTAVYVKAEHGYVGYIEEIPLVNSHGLTLDEARSTLHELAALVFDDERRNSRERTAGKDVVREPFLVRASAVRPNLEPEHSR